jgi:hypothetical protein
MYRQRLEKQSFATIEEYAEDFIAYLSGSRVLFSEKRQCEFFQYVWDAYVATVNRLIVSARDKYLETHSSMSIPLRKELVERIIAEEKTRLQKKPLRKTIPAEFERDILRKYSDDIDQIADRLYKPLTASAREQLCSLAPLIFARDDEIPDLGSGLVVAGFGEQEVFPVVKAYTCHGILLDRLIYSSNENGSFESDGGCIVIPYAQTDVVNSFLKGVDFRNLKFLRRYFAVVCRGLSQTFMKAVAVPAKEKGALASRLQKATETALANWDERILNHLKEKHHIPLLDAVSVLPKEELAALAEALVNLTSIKHKVSLRVETVGGPTDVAVISKGDGFVWIRRKRYFDARRNPHLSKNT